MFTLKGVLSKASKLSLKYFSTIPVSLLKLGCRVRAHLSGNPFRRSARLTWVMGVEGVSVMSWETVLEEFGLDSSNTFTSVLPDEAGGRVCVFESGLH